MKKSILSAFAATLVLAACSKKETATESDTMLPEPQQTAVSDSSTAVQDSPTKAYGDGSPEAPDSVSIDPQSDVQK